MRHALLVVLALSVASGCNKKRAGGEPDESRYREVTPEILGMT